MLYPQNNRARTVLDLSGIWGFRIDKDNVGEKENWQKGFIADGPIGIPGSWNEQLAERGLMHYIGSVWLQTSFFIPDALNNLTFILHFGSADFRAKVWLNNVLVGKHEGGFLPFEFDISAHINNNNENNLVVRVDNSLTGDTIPQGLTYDNHVESNRKRDQTFPLSTFDFLPYGGLQRPVKLIALNKYHIDYIKIDTKIDNNDGIILFEAEIINSPKCTAVVKLFSGETELKNKSLEITTDTIKGKFTVNDCNFWEPDTPFLYRIHFELMVDNQLLDEYYLDIGIREVKIAGDKLLLNGKPVFLKGFGKHEDFDIIGKGLSYPLLVKDFELLKWIGANSFRTSHYPYSEEVMQMADKYGFLVIDEVPAVSLNFKYVTEKTLKNHKNALKELIQRDRNHPSVISWCLGNEPGIWGEEEALSEKADQYWAEIYNYTKTMDNRPCTIPSFSLWREKDIVYKYSDYISVNRYWGWYEIPGELGKAAEILKDDLNIIYERYKKPVLITEFGADTIEGEHATYPQLFTEEYQTLFIKKYFEVIENLPFTIGEQIWNFADFKTSQHFRRVVLNRKGVFNRQRKPKSSAFAIRKHWNKDKTD